MIVLADACRKELDACTDDARLPILNEYDSFTVNLVMNPAKSGRFKNCSVSFSSMENTLAWHLKGRETDLIGVDFLETSQVSMYQYIPAAQSNHSSVSSNFG